MKLKLTKNELKKQREALQRFERYLPTLQLKKQQLQFEILRIERKIEEINHQIEMVEKEIYPWVDVFSEEVDWDKLLKLKKINIEMGNIAGIDIPLFTGVEFEEKDYDFFSTPLWVDEGIKVCKKRISLEAQRLIYEKQRDILKEELRITTQRVNLFEKVKIPQTKENIRKIRIYLGDLQTAGVVRGKFAKAYIERKVYQ
ncbi:MAG: V-type ATP synthase subunit D [Candidatus Omnitrophica bacterium]|nr:V-type ATP synthase subunit D [Candidatus Omnitrophota bacterium]